MCAVLLQPMGQCLSCCHESSSTLQNGHPGSSSQPSKPASSMPLIQPVTVSKYLPEQPLPPPPISGDYNTSSSRRGSNGEKKMFTPYPKLPPIKKPQVAAGDAKRTSFSGRDFSEAKIQLLFEQYKDENEDAILAEGIEAFCDDLNVGPEEFRVLVLAWKFDAETMCRFTRAEFVNGCQKLRVDSTKSIQQRFPDLLMEVQNKQAFKDLYRWTYKFGLDTDTGQRTLVIDMAISLWKLVFSTNEPPILPRWLAFLQDHPSIRGIPKDTWDMFLNFTEAVGSDLSTYDDTEAWPSLFDDFVEYENDRQNQNVTEKNGKDNRNSIVE